MKKRIQIVLIVLVTILLLIPFVFIIFQLVKVSRSSVAVTHDTSATNIKTAASIRYEEYNTETINLSEGVTVEDIVRQYFPQYDKSVVTICDYDAQIGYNGEVTTNSSMESLLNFLAEVYKTEKFDVRLRNVAGDTIAILQTDLNGDKYLAVSGVLEDTEEGKVTIVYAKVVDDES